MPPAVDEILTFYQLGDLHLTVDQATGSQSARLGCQGGTAVVNPAMHDSANALLPYRKPSLKSPASWCLSAGDLVR